MATPPPVHRPEQDPKVVSLYCRCGCGSRLRPGDKFVQGHHTKGPRSECIPSEAYPANVYIGSPLDDVLLRAYADAIDRLCCVECSNRRCRKRDGTCWAWVE